MNFNDKLDFVKSHFKNWNKKTQVNVGDNHLYKIVGSGKKSFKVLWFSKAPGVKHPVWNQNWWFYNDLDEIGHKVVEKMYTQMNEKQGEQTTL